jgi:DNA-binding GntR family transcriptional regulator
MFGVLHKDASFVRNNFTERDKGKGRTAVSRSKDDTPGTPKRVHNKLKEMVISWELPPGAYLAVGRLAEQLNVSVTPVREALMRLCGEGLVECIASRGFFVKSLT